MVEGTSTTLTCSVDAPPNTSSNFDIVWTWYRLGSHRKWNSSDPTSIEGFVVERGELVEDTASSRKVQVSTLVIQSEAATVDTWFTCWVNSVEIELENAVVNNNMTLGVYCKYLST